MTDLKGLAYSSVRNTSYEQSDLLNRKLIEGGGVPSGILKVASSLNKDAKQRVKDEWRRMNSNESIAIIDSGLEYQSIGVSSSDMQFMESQRYNQQQIAAVFKVPCQNQRPFKKYLFER